jgi:hypothetical protein
VGRVFKGKNQNRPDKAHVAWKEIEDSRKFDLGAFPIGPITPLLL